LKKKREQEAGEKLLLAQQNSKRRVVYDSDSSESNLLHEKEISNSNKRKRKETVKLKNVDGSDGMEDDSDRQTEQEEEESILEQMVFRRRYSQLNGQLLAGLRLVKASNYAFLDYIGLVNNFQMAAGKIIAYKDFILTWLNDFQESNNNVKVEISSQDETQNEILKALSSCSD